MKCFNNYNSLVSLLPKLNINQHYQPSDWSLTDQPAGSFCLVPPWFRLMDVKFAKNIIFGAKKNMHCSFLLTQSLNKN